MADERDEDRKDVLTRLSDSAAAAVVAGSAALATGSSVEAAAVQAAAAAAAPLFGKIAAKIVSWRAARQEKWLRDVIAGDTPDAVASAARVLEEHADEAWFRHVVLESIRRVDEAIDDAVIPALGRLAREYLNDRRPPDPFFRGLSRVLTDVGAEEFASLQEITVRALASHVERPLTFIVFEKNRVTLIRERNPPPDTKDHWETLGSFEGARHVLHLLTANGFGFEPNLIGANSYGDRCEVDETDLRRIKAIVTPPNKAPQ